MSIGDWSLSGVLRNQETTYNQSCPGKQVCIIGRGIIDREKGGGRGRACGGSSSCQWGTFWSWSCCDGRLRYQSRGCWNHTSGRLHRNSWGDSRWEEDQAAEAKGAGKAGSQLEALLESKGKGRFEKGGTSEEEKPMDAEESLLVKSYLLRAFLSAKSPLGLYSFVVGEKCHWKISWCKKIR